MPVLRWLAPSSVGAGAGALAAGAIEGRFAASVVGGLATTGFLAILVVPLLLAASLLGRGVVAAWQPQVLAARLTDADGAAPRLAGWLAVLALGVLALAFATFQSVWALALYTAFKPLTLSFLQPMIAVATALAILALSRPGARLVGWLAGSLDARWRRRGRRTLLRPRILLVTTGLTLLAIAAALWWLVIKPRLGPLDTRVLRAPATAAITAVIVHALWSRLGRARLARLAIGLACAALTLAAIGTAWFVARSQPSLTLEIWGDRPLAGFAIERLFRLDDIRDRISLTAFRPTARPGAPHPDVILITIDTVRADHTPPYGGQAAMPALQELGARGVVFEWAFSPSNVTRRSIPSIVTGLAPNRVRGRVVGWALRVDPRHVLLAERMRAGGYDTAGFMCCDGFWGSEFHTGLERGLSHLEIDPGGSELAQKARTWLDAREQRAGAPPLFLWMHLLEPHNWTKTSGEPRNDDERRTFYDRSLTRSDQLVRQVLDAFSARPPERMPIIIVTADHGEALGEHGQPFHSTDLYNAQIHVPLVIQGPGIPAHRVSETVSLTDLVPTILELAGFVPPRDAMDGRSLADLATGARPGDPDGGLAFAAMIKDRSSPGGLTAVIKGRWKLIDTNGSLELYDTRADPGERKNLLGQRPEITTELRILLDRHAAAAALSPFTTPPPSGPGAPRR